MQTCEFWFSNEVKVVGTPAFTTPKKCVSSRSRAFQVGTDVHAQVEFEHKPLRVKSLQVESRIFGMFQRAGSDTKTKGMGIYMYV